MAYELEKLKTSEDFVTKLTTTDGEKLTVRVGRFIREAQREAGRGRKYVQQGIKIFSVSERKGGINRKQFPQAEYWEDKDFELVDLPYITIWLFEASSCPVYDSLENFLQALEAFLSDPRLVPSKFFERQVTPFTSLEDFFRQVDDFLACQETIETKDSLHGVASAKDDFPRKKPLDYSQLELF